MQANDLGKITTDKFKEIVNDLKHEDQPQVIHEDKIIGGDYFLDDDYDGDPAYADLVITSPDSERPDVSFMDTVDTVEELQNRVDDLEEQIQDLHKMIAEK